MAGESRNNKTQLGKLIEAFTDQVLSLGDTGEAVSLSNVNFDQVKEAIGATELKLNSLAVKTAWGKLDSDDRIYSIQGSKENKVYRSTTMKELTKEQLLKIATELVRIINESPDPVLKSKALEEASRSAKLDYVKKQDKASVVRMAMSPNNFPGQEISILEDNYYTCEKHLKTTKSPRKTPRKKKKDRGEVRRVKFFGDADDIGVDLGGRRIIKKLRLPTEVLMQMLFNGERISLVGMSPNTIIELGECFASGPTPGGLDAEGHFSSLTIVTK
jgi:hypothetical protein